MLANKNFPDGIQMLRGFPVTVVLSVPLKLNFETEGRKKLADKAPAELKLTSMAADPYAGGTVCFVAQKSENLIPSVLAFYDMFHVRGKTSLVVSN